MAKIKGPKKTNAYLHEFKIKAVQLANQPDILAKDVAEDLGIHPILLYRWRKEYREGKFKEDKRKKKLTIETKKVAGSKECFVLDNNLIRLHNDFIMKPFGGVYMATVTVKNIPDELYDRLKSVAEINRRSINSEIIMCIENTVISRRINLDEVLENARQLRQLTAGHLISDEEFNQAKAEGRL
jgi:transposase-like protein/plasmid stability protein